MTLCPSIAKACRSSLGRLALTLAGIATLVGTVSAQTPLPPEVEAALARARLPRDAVSLLVADADGRLPPRLSHRANVAMNPASVMKLVTTYAALDLLGPAYTWGTPVYLEGTVREGTLNGNLYIKGQGDPKLVAERLWLLLRRVQGLGVKTIAGDIVLDRSAFDTVAVDPGSFDGEPLRPYNATPDALLLNFKSVVMSFVPDRTVNAAQVAWDAPLAGVQMQTSVPLSAGPCDDYRSTLKADFSDPLRIRFLGSYPASCGEKTWPVAYADPKNHAARLVEGLWQDMGGKLGGVVREGRVPTPAGSAMKPVFEVASPPLAEVIRDINKYSNNVMAQQVFLSLSLQARAANAPPPPAATFAASRELLARWWQDRLGGDDAPVLDNGSGLSRSERISALALARMLQAAYASPNMPELMSSLPISGVDGTLRNLGSGLRSKAQGSAHLKSGSLSNVLARAGYVLANNGKRYVLVLIVNHANAAAARPAFEALLDWTLQGP